MSEPLMTVAELVQELRRCADEIESLGRPLDGHGDALMLYAHRIERGEISPPFAKRVPL